MGDKRCGECKKVEVCMIQRYFLGAKDKTYGMIGFKLEDLRGFIGERCEHFDRRQKK